MDEKIQFVILQRVDLMTVNPPMVYAQALEHNNNGAHEWQVHVVASSQSVDLTGCTVACYAARSDKKTVYIKGKTVGSVASVVFNSEFYAINGEIAARMEFSGSDGRILTVARLYCTVTQTGTDTIIDPSGEIPSLENLMAMIDEMKAVTQAAEDAANAANAAAASANFVVLGQYDTLELLKAARPTGNVGDAWAIGTAEPYVVYIWDVDAQDYKAIGQLQGPTGPQGIQGAPGRGVQSVVLTSGDHSPGTFDTYTMYYTDGTSMPYMVYNGKDGKDGSPGANGSDAQAIVYTINGESADSKGNFALSAADVGARASDWMPTAAQVGALPSSYTAPVTSVNSKTGAVTLNAADVGARANDWMPTAAQVGALPSSYTAPVSSVNGKTGAVTVPVLKLGFLQYDAPWDSDQNAIKIPVSAFSNPASTTDASKLCFIMQIYGKTCIVGDSFVSGSYLYVRLYNSSWENWGTGERVNIIYQTA